MTDPSETGGDADPDVPGHHHVGEGMRPDAIDLTVLVIRIEVGFGAILTAAVLPLITIKTDVDSETDVSHVLDTVEVLRRSLRLEARHQRWLAQIHLQEDVIPDLLD